MATFLELENLAQNVDFQKRCTWALRKIAQDILNENPSTPDHALRESWAKRVALNTITIPKDTLVFQVLRNPTIATLGAAATDSDIQFAATEVLTVIIRFELKDG